MFGWIKKKTKAGFNVGKDQAKKVTNFEEVKKNWSDISVMYDTLANPKKVAKDGVRKTFSQTVKDKNLTQDDIAKIYFNYAMGFYISLFFAFVCFVSALYSAFINASIVGFIVGVAIMAICVANMFRFSFDTFKIQHQKFCSVQDWWNNPAHWFPKFRL